MTAQTTLRQPITCGGTGVHSGRDVTLTLRPASANRGVVFRRVDITDRDN
ncbi:MAG: UDP-3-O-acyl-N-acetylglucosamine deacetylase, partial [Pseudomonadota bacterium]|nr:UDP-3-O-acyl-N-acetylglucosamine deacetylase [Pseudomonadota bacterium]